MNHPELPAYLKQLIDPPDGGVVLIVGSDPIPDQEAAVHGIVFTRPPSEVEVQSAYRALKPGGFCFSVAESEDPTNFQAAVALEDAGFEIRDALLLVDSLDERWKLTPKANRIERELGCHDLSAVRSWEATGSKEGQARLNSPRTGAGRTSAEIHNEHPTVKPVEVMRWASRDVPKDAPLLDPFVGSGTTLVACALDQRSGTGVERESRYQEIARSRIRYWAEREAGWASNVKLDIGDAPPKPEAGPVNLADLLGFGDE